MAKATARKNPAPPGYDAPRQRSGAAQIVDANLFAPSGVKRVALIGANETAQAHADILKTLKGVRLEGIVDADLNRARTFAWRNGGIAAAATLRDLLAAQPLDAVHVLAPEGRRADVLQDALSLGLSVLTESPLAWDFAAAQDLAHTAAA